MEIDSLFINPQTDVVDAFLGGVQDLLNRCYGSELNVLHGMILRVANQRDDQMKLATILFVVNKEEAMQRYFQEKMPPRKWMNFQQGLAKATESLLDGRVEPYEYVKICTESYLIS